MKSKSIKKERKNEKASKISSNTKSKKISTKDLKKLKGGGINPVCACTAKCC